MKRFVLFLLCGLAAAGLGLAWWLGPSAFYQRGLDVVAQLSARTAPAPLPARTPPPPSVEIAPVETVTVSDEVEALGTLSANESVVIAPEIAGRLTHLGFGEGDQVQKGQVLIELDTAILEQELKQAQVDLGLARDTFERARDLVGRGAGTRVAVEQSQAQFTAAQVRVGLAQARLDKARIEAPIEGIVGLRSVSVGNYVTAGQALVTLTDIDPIKVDFRVPELLLSKVGVGQKVRVKVDAFPSRSFEGEVYAIDPVVDVNGRAIRLRAQIPNADMKLKPGLFARVTIVTDTRPGALVIPESAIVPDGTAKAVYVYEDGRVKLTRVELGKRLPGKVEITAGLRPDAKVVATGQMRLRDGIAVDAARPRAEAMAAPLAGAPAAVAAAR